MYRLLHAGFDKLDVAFAAEIPETLLLRLAVAKEAAALQREPAFATLGPNKLPAHVMESGGRGGYAFVVDTGTTGERLLFKQPRPKDPWTVFASVKAETLLTLGYHGAQAQLLQRLADLGVRIAEASVNRVDFAIDFLAPGFVLDPNRFATRGRAKERVHWADGKAKTEAASMVIAGRAVQSVTVGKMPGRQVIVYDKRAEVLVRGTKHWFEAWGIAPEDATACVWRIELRAGKKELKECWHIRSFAELEAGIGPMLRDLMQAFRYLAAGEHDSNVSRRAPDPLWLAAAEVLQRQLADFGGGLARDRLIELTREGAREIYRQQLIGNAIGLLVTEGLANDAILAALPAMLGEPTEPLSPTERWRIRDAIRRARERLHFVAG